MCLAPLLPRPSEGIFMEGVTHPGSLPRRCAFLYLGFLVLLVQLRFMDGRNCWGGGSLGLEKIMFALYLCAVF